MENVTAQVEGRQGRTGVTSQGQGWHFRWHNIPGGMSACRGGSDGGVHGQHPNCCAPDRSAHTLGAVLARTAGRWRQGHGTSQRECPFHALRRNRLTKCAGDGDLVSLTVALVGTSRRGHFICRYCTGDRKQCSW